MQIEAKLEAMGLALPAAAKAPPGIRLSFDWVRVHGDRAYVSGHGPLNPDGSVAGPFGKVEAEVSPEQAHEAARLTALAVLASLKRELGDLDRIAAWLMVHGMVNAVPGSVASTNVINGFSDLIIELYGPEIGRHARTAVGMAALPLNLCVIIAAEVAIRD
jgi:enamine deaminase RidA (YjgF/YER057c/UK114 family)